MANNGLPAVRRTGTNHGQDRNSPTTPENVRNTTELMVKAANLRAAGATFREIGAELNIDATWAHTLVMRALDASTYEAADVMRRLEGERLDKLQKGSWIAACKGDARAALTVLRIMERRARLFGLDAPVQLARLRAEQESSLDAVVTSLTSPEQLVRLYREQQQMEAAEAAEREAMERAQHQLAPTGPDPVESDGEGDARGG